MAFIGFGLRKGWGEVSFSCVAGFSVCNNANWTYRILIGAVSQCDALHLSICFYKIGLELAYREKRYLFQIFSLFTLKYYARLFELDLRITRCVRLLGTALQATSPEYIIIASDIWRSQAIGCLEATWRALANFASTFDLLIFYVNCKEILYIKIVLTCSCTVALAVVVVAVICKLSVFFCLCWRPLSFVVDVFCLRLRKGGNALLYCTVLYCKLWTQAIACKSTSKFPVISM